ncbi:MAG: hypothetical protein ACREXJ_12010, partial [Gammaproteobacteria bacterium]
MNAFGFITADGCNLTTGRGNTLFAAGGVPNFGGLLDLSRSFISRNIVPIGRGILNAFGFITAHGCNLTTGRGNTLFAAGGVSNFGARLTLGRSFISRNIVPIGPGILNAFGFITAHGCNLFGLNNFLLSSPVQREKSNAER